MIIVSQDKRIITNFDKTIGLQINEHILNSDGERDFEIRAITEKRDCVIAFYETEERAKEMLQEIISLYKKTDCVIGIGDSLKQVVNLPKVYEMPKE